MEVIHKSEGKIITFSDLKVGDCFRVKDHDRWIYMKAEQEHNFVCLKSGVLGRYPYDTEVTPVNGKFIEE
jgi:flagellar motor switch protein FliM